MLSVAWSEEEERGMLNGAVELTGQGLCGHCHKDLDFILVENEDF